MGKNWTNPGNVSFEVSTTGETAFQRAIYLLGSSNIEGLGNVRWLDLELPVDEKRRGRGHCIDLIGRSDDMTMVICELKFGKPGNGDPEKAQQQLQNYFNAVKKNYEKLDLNDGEHHRNALKAGYFLWKEIASDTTKLVVAANRDYWEYWHKRGCVFPDSVLCYSIDVPTKVFKNQKEAIKGEKYLPKVEVGNWNLINDNYFISS